MALFRSRNIRLHVKNYRNIVKRNKYFVLLPEIPDDTPATNLLLRTSSVPPFSQITTVQCINAIAKLVAEHESALYEFQEKLEQDPGIPKNVQNVILPLDQLTAPLDFAWGTLKLLSTVKTDEAFSSAYRKLYPRVLKAKNERYLYPSIYRAFKELKSDERRLTESVQRVTNKYLLESQMSGIDLSTRNIKSFRDTVISVEKFKKEYRKNLLEVTNNFSHILTREDNVDDLPRELLRSTAVNSLDYTKGPWKITLAPHIYQCFLEHCPDRLLRWNVWHANVTRASASSGSKLSNSIPIEEIRYHRQEQATVLGFKTFADLSMKTKMAGSVDNAMAMIHTLYAKSKDHTVKEIGRLQEFATSVGFPHELQLWDIPFWQRVQKQEEFKLDESAVRQYFPFPTVLRGMLRFCEQIFDIKIVEKTSEVDKWHEDVTYYKIYDQNGKYLSAFFLDPYTRPESKLPGCTMEIGRNRSTVADAEPLSYLIMNFHPPQFGQPSLLSYNDINLLFQKFGHILQHSLTTVPYADVAGLINLEWDVVYVVPHVLSHWLRHYNTVAKLSGHVDSGAPIPVEMHRKLQKAHKHMAGLRLTEQLYLSAVDLDLYSRKGFWMDIMKQNWKQYMLFPFDKFQAHLCSFPQIFCDDFPAAYFSFVWAEMIAADVFSAFEEVGLDEKEAVKEVGIRFRDTYLALGGGCHPSEVFRRFRGRDPSTEALLTSYGIHKPTAVQR